MASFSEAEEALRALSVGLKKSGKATALSTLQLMTDIGLDDEMEQLKAEMVADVRNAISIAEGEAGDSADITITSPSRRGGSWLGVT